VWLYNVCFRGALHSRRIGRASGRREPGRDHRSCPAGRTAALIRDGDNAERTCIVPDVVDATCEPRDTLAVGALIESAPAVSVKEAGVAAAADKTVMLVSVPPR